MSSAAEPCPAVVPFRSVKVQPLASTVGAAPAVVGTSRSARPAATDAAPTTALVPLRIPVPPLPTGPDGIDAR